MIKASEIMPPARGADVSGVTATASDVLQGKKFVDSTKTTITGTIDSQVAQTIIPTTSDQTISSGKYLSGDQIIKGDSNLVAGNIASGVTIFNVTGTLTGEQDWYKCASVVPGSSGTDIIVSGITSPVDANGTYTLQDSTATGTERVWEKEGTTYSIDYRADWCLTEYGRPYDQAFFVANGGGTDDPVTTTTWIANTGTGSPVLTQATGTPSWSGYKLTFSASGVTYASDSTSGLAISDSQPVINGIYNQNATKRFYQSTLLAQNIKKDVQLFGVTGSYQGGSTVVPGYFINTDGVVTFMPVGQSQSQSVSAISIVDTGVDQPQYEGKALAQLYKVTSVSDSYQGVKAIAYQSSTDTFTFASTQETLTASTAPSIDYLYTVLNGTILGSALKYVGEYPAASAPNGVMTSNTTTSDGSDWQISGNMGNMPSSSTTYLFWLFKGSNDNVFLFNNSSYYVTWYSATPRLVKRLVARGGYSNGTVMLQGSSNGNDWSDIGEVSLSTSGTTTTTFEDNTSAYTYHRLKQSGSSYPGIYEIYAYSTLS